MAYLTSQGQKTPLIRLMIQIWSFSLILLWLGRSVQRSKGTRIKKIAWKVPKSQGENFVNTKFSQSMASYHRLKITISLVMVMYKFRSLRLGRWKNNQPIQVMKRSQNWKKRSSSNQLYLSEFYDLVWGPKEQHQRSNLSHLMISILRNARSRWM